MNWNMILMILGEALSMAAIIYITNRNNKKK